MCWIFRWPGPQCDVVGIAALFSACEEGRGILWPGLQRLIRSACLKLLVLDMTLSVVWREMIILQAPIFHMNHEWRKSIGSKICQHVFMSVLVAVCIHFSNMAPVGRFFSIASEHVSFTPTLDEAPWPNGCVSALPHFAGIHLAGQLLVLNVFGVQKWLRWKSYRAGMVPFIFFSISCNFKFWSFAVKCIEPQGPSSDTRHVGHGLSWCQVRCCQNHTRHLRPFIEVSLCRWSSRWGTPMSELIRDSTKKMMKRVLSRCIRMGYLIWLLSI